MKIKNPSIVMQGGGEPEWLNGVYNISFYRTLEATWTLPETLTLNIPNCKRIEFGSISDVLDNGCRHLNILMAEEPSGFAEFLLRNAYLETVTFLRPIKPATFRQFAYGTAGGIRRIEGGIDFSYCTTASQFGYTFPDMPNLEFIDIIPNTLMIGPERFGAKITDEGLVNIANGLNPDVTGQTVSFHATPKARLSTLMGSVSEGVFTADEAGTVSCADFITTIKGWSIA